MAKKANAALVATDRRIGVSKLRFKMGTNTFTIYGQNIGVGDINKKTVYLTANNHVWSKVTAANVAGNDNVLQITATCTKKKHKPHHARPDVYDGDDDLTVTITFDDVTPTDVVDCTFADVDYDP